MLQWGPVVVTGISDAEGSTPRPISMLQWGPVVVTGIRGEKRRRGQHPAGGFNGVRSW